jgi:hypothetical protein
VSFGSNCGGDKIGFETKVVGGSSSGGMPLIGCHQWLDSRQKEHKPLLFSLTQEVIVNKSLPEHLLPKDAVVQTECGIGRTMQQGHATHATNEGILEKDVQRLARWRMVENAGGKQANLGGTKEAHSDVMQMLKTLLRATRDL